MRDRIAEGFQLFVEGRELGGAPPDALFQLFVESAEFFLGTLALGDVASRGEDQAPPFVLNGPDTNLDRKGGAILAPQLVVLEAYDLARRAALRVSIPTLGPLRRCSP